MRGNERTTLGVRVAVTLGIHDLAMCHKCSYEYLMNIMKQTKPEICKHPPWKTSSQPTLQVQHITHTSTFTLHTLHQHAPRHLSIQSRMGPFQYKSKVTLSKTWRGHTNVTSLFITGANMFVDSYLGLPACSL